MTAHAFIRTNTAGRRVSCIRVADVAEFGAYGAFSVVFAADNRAPIAFEPCTLRAAQEAASLFMSGREVMAFSTAIALAKAETAVDLLIAQAQNGVAL